MSRIDLKKILLQLPSYIFLIGFGMQMKVKERDKLKMELIPRQS